jgi:hypothetical protein
MLDKTPVVRSQIDHIMSLRAKRDMLTATYDDAIKQATTALQAYMKAAGIEKTISSTALAYSRTVKDATVTDWAEVFQFIEKNQAYDLLQRRLHVSSTLARIEAGEDVLGVTVSKHTEFVVRALPKKGDKDAEET